MTRITSDVETLNELFSSGLVTVFGDLFMLFFIVAAMLQMNTELALVTFSVLPFVAWVAFVFRSRIRSAYRDIRVRLARMNAFLQERFTGIRIVQLFNREEADLGRFKVLNDDYLAAHLRSITYYALFFPVIQLLTAVALALIIWYGGGAMIQGAVTIGVLAAFLDYARPLLPPPSRTSPRSTICYRERWLRRSGSSGSWTGNPRSRTRPTRLGFPPAPRGRSASRTCGLPTAVTSAPARAMEGSRVVARARARPGAPSPIGSSGTSPSPSPPARSSRSSGTRGPGRPRSSNLLMRFYEIQRGRILVDGIPIERLRMKELRDRIGLVLQDIFLFSQSVDYNVRLGSSSIDEGTVTTALDAVGATPFVERLPEGSAQELGERGASLSVGERQLLSFARALAFDPDILVLDEATSSVDSEIEARIEEATDRLMQGRTSLVIAHRLSTVQGADRILVMHHGRLVEEGSHEELLEGDGLYRRLHELQFAGVAA